jgi:hypothetical protein
MSNSIIESEVGEALWGKWISASLADGSLRGKPDPLVVGQGLDKFQIACDRYTEGVSAQKIVVELP